jgi:hypothetical protein
MNGLRRSAILWRLTAFAGCGVLGVLLGSIVSATDARNERPADSTVISVAESSPSRDELVLMLVVSPTCAASRHPDLPRLWTDIVAGTENRLDSLTTLRLVGVVLSGDPGTGMSFIERFGHFDEVITGGGVGNVAALRYLFADYPGPPVLPQVIWLSRVFSATEAHIPTLGSENVVARVWGVDPITAVAARGGRP